jgi:DNA mismatch repair protein MutS
MSGNDITPIRQQYLDIKRAHPDEIVFFRLGDFYETFDKDAEIASRELDIILTSRSVSKGARIPMAGIPYHAVESYLARLIDKGYHIAICEQVGDQPIKGLFQRRVVRIVTPGTIMEDSLLPGDTNNYLTSIVIQEKQTASAASVPVGLAHADITTGEFAVTELYPESLRAELVRLRPREIILSSDLKFDPVNLGHLSPMPAWRFEVGRCEETLLQHFKTLTLDGFGLKGHRSAVQAAGVIIQYIQETQPEALSLLNNLRYYNLNEFMSLDAATRRNLEIEATLSGEKEGSLLGVLDCTHTPMGKRLIHQWINQPLVNLEMITKRQEAVHFLYKDGVLRAEVRASLKSLTDLERLANRILAGGALPRDLLALRENLSQIPSILELFKSHESNDNNLVNSLDPCIDELKLLENSISEDPPATLQSTGYIRPGYSEELDSIIKASTGARDWIANLESVERKRTGIRTLKVGYNKVFGYFLEISRGASSNAPDNYIRKQTLVNAERYITPELKEYETIVLNAEERIREVELRLFKEICTTLGKSIHRLLKSARSLAELDVLASLAEVAALNKYTKPTLHEGNQLDIREGRHPVVEQTIRGSRFIPNDLILETGEIIRVITGPNMSGKSTYLRQAALIVLLAQIGSFVPAESANIGLVDRIFTRIGAQDEIHAGQSTFMVEMIEAASILHNATQRSLLILDEIGRGTSTYDGVSIAWAVVEYIHNHPRLRAKTLFATHYHELTQLAELLPGVRNYNVSVAESGDEIVFLHKIISGGADKSYGIHVAQLAGLPAPVVSRAREILYELERTAGKAQKLDPNAPRQAALFPETSPLLNELRALDMDTLSPIEALNKVYEWKKNFLE